MMVDVADVVVGVRDVSAETVMEAVVVEVTVQSGVTRQGHRREEAEQRKHSVHLLKNVNQ